MTTPRRLLAALAALIAWRAVHRPAEGGPVALSFVLFGDPTETAGYETLVEEFEQANPDVTVELSRRPARTSSSPGSPPPSPAAPRPTSSW